MNTRLKHKKGQLQFFLENAFRIGFVLFAVFAFMLLINKAIRGSVDTNTLEANVVTTRVLYSDLIMKQDPVTMRVYPGIVDLDKVNEHINDRFIYENERIVGVKIIVYSKESKEKVVEKVTFMNPSRYKELLELRRFTGIGGSEEYYREYPITIIDSTGERYGILGIHILVPRS